MDQKRERTGAVRGIEVDREHLSDPAHPGNPGAGDVVEAGLERLQSGDARRKRGFHLGPLERRGQASSGDLDLGQLGHEAKRTATQPLVSSFARLEAA